MNVFDKINDAIRNTEGSAVNALSAIAPWGAPLAPAYMAYHGMVDKLAFDPTIALILAAVIEILGLATVSTTLQFWQHNRRYSTEDKRQPVNLAGGMFLFYLAVILTTNVLLEWPRQGEYNPIIARGLLSLLSVPAAITMAVRTQYAEMRRGIEEEKAKRKQARQTSKSQRQNATNVGQNDIPTFRRGYDGFVDYMAWIDQQGGGFDKNQAAQVMGRSTRQIERYVEHGRNNGLAEKFQAMQRKEGEG